MASVSLMWVFCIRNIIRKVMKVVPGLNTSCQVSLKWKTGPVMIHAAITSSASKKAPGRPQNLDARLAKLVYLAVMRMSDPLYGAFPRGATMRHVLHVDGRAVIAVLFGREARRRGREGHHGFAHRQAARLDAR